jgi:tetratricopeptide (TPR) repeat protein
MTSGDEPTVASSDAGQPDAGTIDRYRLLQKIGEGGMGEVWLAEQSHPIRRRVALKVIKTGMDTKQVVARFESERQALALMDHPAIAGVLDAGSTPQGRPYFVMEYVPGVPITEYCDRNRLTTAERLELFLQVCAGVQHAHQKAIIHRDLKPSNVLVTLQDQRAVPKIIDFGVAKATASQRLTERTMFTEIGVLIGTPGYMSPEQAGQTAQDIDTRTDVYALGVMLYELLAGATPFDEKTLRQAGLEEMLRRIREDEPVKPSARFSAAGEASTASARLRKSEPAALRKKLQGDLDWITMKALEKDRARRYGSPAELAADIERHLRSVPVVAGPPSVSYRAGKFIRRHRFGVAVAAGVVVLLAALAVSQAVQARRVARERDRANTEAATAKQTADFLAGLFHLSDPSETKGATITAREILDKGADAIEKGQDNTPAVQARLLNTIASVYRNLGLLERAETIARRGLAVNQELFGPGAVPTLSSKVQVGMVLADRGRLADAEPLIREAYEGFHALLPKDAPERLQSAGSLGYVLEMRGNLKDAERYIGEALEGLRRTAGDDSQDTINAISDMGVLLRTQGRLKEAEGYYRESLDRMRRVLGEDHPDTLLGINNLGYLLRMQGRYSEAEPLLKEAVDRRRRVLGANHPATALSLNNLGTLYRSEGRFAEAEAAIREALEIRRKELGDEHGDTLTSEADLGQLYRLMGRAAEADDFISRAYEGFRKTSGPEHTTTLILMSQLSLVRRLERRLPEAEALGRDALERVRKVVGEEHYTYLSTGDNLALVLIDEKKFAEAESLLRTLSETALRVLPKPHDTTGRLLVDHARALDGLGRRAEAETRMAQALTLFAEGPSAGVIPLAGYPVPARKAS